MNQKFKIQNLLLMVALLFTALFPSIHAIEHIVNASHEHECVHKYGETNSNITHQHENKDKCAICDFTLSSFLNIQRTIYKTAVIHVEIPYFFHATNHRDNFSLAIPPLRGPPQI